MRFLKFFSFDDFNNFGDYFIKILEKLSIDLVIIINLYEHKTMAEDRPIDKISEENYHQFYEKWFHGLTLFTFIKIIRKLFRYHIFLYRITLFASSLFHSVVFHFYYLFNEPMN